MYDYENEATKELLGGARLLMSHGQEYIVT